MLKTFNDYFSCYVAVNPLLSHAKFTEVNGDCNAPPEEVTLWRLTEPVNSMQDQELALQILANKAVSYLGSCIAERLLQKFSESDVTVTETSKVVKIIPVVPYHLETLSINMLSATEGFIFPKTKVAVFEPKDSIPIDLHIGESITREPGLWIRESNGFIQGGFAFTLHEPTCTVTEFKRLVPYSACD